MEYPAVGPPKPSRFGSLEDSWFFVWHALCAYAVPEEPT